MGYKTDRTLNLSREVGSFQAHTECPNRTPLLRLVSATVGCARICGPKLSTMTPSGQATDTGESTIILRIGNIMAQAEAIQFGMADMGGKNARMIKSYLYCVESIALAVH